MKLTRSNQKITRTRKKKKNFNLVTNLSPNNFHSKVETTEMTNYPDCGKSTPPTSKKKKVGSITKQVSKTVSLRKITQTRVPKLLKFHKAVDCGDVESVKRYLRK